MRFYRYHAIGNDYIVIPETELNAPLAPAVIQRICHRNFGIGSDGILLHLSDDAPGRFKLRIFNPDGSESEKSGNGLRIFARYLWDRKLAGVEAFQVMTPAGEGTCRAADTGRTLTTDRVSLTID